MFKTIFASLCFAVCAHGSIVTTITGSCSTYSPTGVVLETETYPNTCLGLPLQTASVTTGFISALNFYMDESYRDNHPPYDLGGNSYSLLFQVNSSLDEWLVVTGGSGSGVIKGTYLSTIDVCCDFSYPTVVGVTDFAGASLKQVSPGINGGTYDYAIPFVFGVPFHIAALAQVGHTGFFNSGAIYDEVTVRVTMSGIYDTSGNWLSSAGISEAPEPGTWLMLLCGAVLLAVKVGALPRRRSDEHDNQGAPLYAGWGD